MTLCARIHCVQILADLEAQSQNMDTYIAQLNHDLQMQQIDPEFADSAFVTDEDIRNIPSFRYGTLFLASCFLPLRHRMCLDGQRQPEQTQFAHWYMLHQVATHEVLWPSCDPRNSQARAKPAMA